MNKNLTNLTDEELGDKIELTMHSLSCPCGYKPSNQHEQYELLKAYWQEEQRRLGK